VPPLTKRELYGKLGGHPYTIDVFARRAAVTGVADVWLEIEDVEREMIEFTLLDRTYAQLPPRAQTLLLRARILEEAPPLEALQWMMGDEDDAMPAVDAELKALLGWGMLARQETGRGEVVYPMHALVRDYARRQLAEESAEDETALLLRAARFWELRVEQTRNLWDYLRARDYYYRAGEYRKAWHIVEAACEYLVRWGYIEMTIKLLNESIETLEGTAKAVAMGNLATVYQNMGDYEMALKVYEQVRALFEEQGDKRNVAVALHQIGIVYQAQGNYSEAQAKVEQSLALNVEVGDKRGIAYSLGQLGRIHQEQGNLGEARAKFEQSLAIDVELGNKSGIAKSLHNLGRIHQEQGNLGEAQAKFEQSLAIEVELGDKLGIAQSLHQLGMIHQEQGSYREALEKWVQALMLFEQLGSPDAEKARHNLALLREEMGEEAFAAALAELEAEARGVPEPGAVTLGQMVDMVVQNTVAVMTEVPEQREEWWGALGQLQVQARQHGEAGFAAFLGVVRQVVEGADPARVSAELEESFAEAWRRLVEGLQQRTCELNELN
jgi:tetratricopeptide (TPR) repeat protein